MFEIYSDDENEAAELMREIAYYKRDIPALAVTADKKTNLDYTSSPVYDSYATACEFVMNRQKHIRDKGDPQSLLFIVDGVSEESILTDKTNMRMSSLSMYVTKQCCTYSNKNLFLSSSRQKVITETSHRIQNPFCILYIIVFALC